MEPHSLQVFRRSDRAGYHAGFEDALDVVIGNCPQVLGERPQSAEVQTDRVAKEKGEED